MTRDAEPIPPRERTSPDETQGWIRALVNGAPRLTTEQIVNLRAIIKRGRERVSDDSA